MLLEGCLLLLEEGVMEVVPVEYIVPFAEILFVKVPEQIFYPQVVRFFFKSQVPAVV